MMRLYERIILLIFLFVLQKGVNSFTIYDVRLGSSSTSPATSGRVEILTQHGWTPLCDYSWGSSESRVVCRQLGYDYSTYNQSSSSSENSLEYSLYCSGHESSILQCYYYFYMELSSCGYINTVNCVPCISGSVQISGGDEAEQGTVEYCSDGSWMGVCDSGWSNIASFVVCRQLGFPATGAIGYRYSHSGFHSFPSGIYFNCFGNETSLSSCRSSNSSYCRSHNIAEVQCRGEVITSLCINGHFRLSGGENSNEGRVEICSNGVWGTVWDGWWDSLDATVFCRQLGLYQAYSRVEVFYNGYFGSGTGPIVYTYLQCDGTESRLTNCRTSSSFYFSASHSDDAGVRCQRPATTIRSNCLNGDVRLVNGTTPYEGRVEICYDGIWGSVCDSSWNDWDAAIVCKQMGFQGTNVTALLNSHFGDGEGPYHLSGLSCSGNENTLLQCPRSSITIGYHTCSPGNDAGVRCDASTCSHGEVRLFGGYTAQYGIAEVCIDGHWADICSRGSSSSANTIASSFCRQHTGQQSISSGIRSCCSGIRRRNTGNITLYNVNCTGQTGTFIHDCSYSIISGYSAGSCNLRSEMLVGCYEPANCNAGEIRLVDGNSTSEGRVEVCTQGLWGAISVSYGWNPSNDATVICRQLGFPWEWALIVTNNLFGQGTSRIVARSIRCSGTEAQLSSCSSRTVTLNSGASYQWPWYTPAGVICQGLNTSRPTECNHGDVQLVSGSRETEGRVEICAYGYWAIACYDYWNIAATHLVCKHQGLPSETSEYLSDSPFGSNYQLPLVGLSCSSRARNISQCQIYNRTSCNHNKIIGVFCKGNREYYKVVIRALPAQEGHEIGSRVTFNCTATPSPQNYGNFTFPLRYRWYFPDRRPSYFSSSNTRTITLGSYEQSIGNCYCLIYRYSGGLLLGQGRTKITTKSILQPYTNMSSPVKIQALLNQRATTLQIYSTSNNFVNLLLELTWYHNGSKIIPEDDPRLNLSNANKTLTISNFSLSHAGVYRAQFDRLLVSPGDENSYCEAEVLSLARNYPVLKPVVFCVNVDGDCSDMTVETRVHKISIQSVDSALQGTFDRLSLVADATVFSTKEFEYSYIYWYRNGRQVYSSSTLQKNGNTLSLSQSFQQFNVSYEHSGRYEVHLIINMYSYLRAGGSTCLPYYNTFVPSYLGSTIVLAKAHMDINYYKDLIFDLDTNKKAIIRDEGATLTCQASIEFPPFSMISFIKNGWTLSSSNNPGSIQIDTKSVDMNQFGLYTCQLNASGVIFQKSYILKEQANFRMTLDVKNSNICSNSEMAVRRIEEALIRRIKRECQCSFSPDGFQNSTINCENGELTYATTLEYSNEEGSETASIIAKRTVGQVPFSMAVRGTQLTVKSACTDCEMPTTKAASLSPAVGGGLFIGGFVAAVLIAIILVIIVVLAVKKCAKSEDKVGRRVEMETDPLRYASSAGAAHQDVSLKGAAESEYMTPQPKQPSVYQTMGPRDQPSQYETMQMGDQPIYEETF